MNFNEKLMACTALRGVWLFQPATAGAQSASEAQKIERLERQTELLQRQLKEIQSELAQTRKRTEKVEAKVEAAPARYSAPPPMATKGPPLPPPPDRVKVTLGGFKPRRRCGDNTTWSTTWERPSRQPRIRSHRFTTSTNFTGPPGRAESRCSSRATSIPTRSFPGITSRTSWASATRRITTRATAGLRACDTPISPMTTLVGEVGDFTSSPPDLEPGDTKPGRYDAAQGEHPAHDRRELRGRVQLYPSMADPRSG